jgi:serralysin
MSDVTIPGGHNLPPSLRFDDASVAALATTAVSQLSAAINAGATVVGSSGNVPLPPLPAGQQGIVSATGPGTYQLTGGYTGIVVGDNVAATVVGGSANGELIISGGPLVATTGTGSATVIGGPGNNLLGTLPTGGGDNRFTAGAGDDTIVAASGNNVITAGTGANLIGITSGNNTVYSQGTDTIVAGSGNDTIGVESGNDVIFGGAGNMTFVNGSGNSTVVGGAGSATIFGGTGGGLFAGGLAGNNLIIAGEGDTTVFGGGGDSTLFAAGAGPDVLAAGTGNQTLSGGSSTGNNTFFAAGAHAVIGGGSGNDVIFGGSADATVAGGGGNNIFAFAASQDSPNTQVVIQDFVVGKDLVSLQGYSVGNALASAQVSGGNLTLTLQDGSKLTFVGVTGLNASSFG